MFTVEEVEKNYEYHHSALTRGYVSRKNLDGIVKPYKGRFGKGYVILTPRWDTTKYCNIYYYIEKSAE